MKDEVKSLHGKTIEWAGIVASPDTQNHTFVIRCTDGSQCIVRAWQNEGFPVEMSAAQEKPVPR